MNIPVEPKQTLSGLPRAPVAKPDLNRLIASMEAGHFVRIIDFSFHAKQNRIHQTTGTMTDNAIISIPSFCNTDSSNSSWLETDMTYKIGPFYMTCLIFAHPYLVHRINPEIHMCI